MATDLHYLQKFDKFNIITYRRKRMQKCPWCNERSISYWDKFWLQSLKLFYPRLPAICKSCKNAVTVPHWNILVRVFFFLIYLFLLPFLLDVVGFYSIYLVIVTTVFTFVLYVVSYSLLVPLIKWNIRKL